MLSFIYRIVSEFQQLHGHPPNVLYLNPIHLQRLLGEFDPDHDFEFIRDFLGMEIVVYPNHAHPQVAWTDDRSDVGAPAAQRVQMM